MRSLIVLVLLALALPSLAMDICPTGSLSGTISTISPGEAYTATGCAMGFVTLSTSDTPTNTTPIIVTVQESVVSGILQIYLTSYSRAPTRPPLYATIQNNVFGNGAGLYVLRSLPPNSILTFQNNQMAGNGTVDHFDYGVGLMIYFENLYLYPNTTVNMISNTLTLNAVTQIGLQVVYLALSTVTVNCTVNILSNTIKANATQGGFLLYTEWFMGENSTLRIDSNTLMGNSTEASLNALELYAVGGIQVSDLQRSFSVAEIEGRNNWVSFSDNVIRVFGRYVDGQVIRLDQADKVNLRIDRNAITTSNGYFIYCDDDVAIPYYASISGNTFASTRTSLTTSLIFVYGFNFASNSTLVIASNTVTAPTVTETPLFVELYSANFDATASIKHCGNTLPWTNSSTTIDQLFSSSVVELVVYDENACVGTPTSTTRAPSSVAKINLLAASVCLFAAVVALL